MKSLSRHLLSIALIALFSGFASVHTVSAQSPLREILRRMDDHNKDLTTLRTGITMAKENTQLGETDVRQGRALYARGEKSGAYYRIDWDKPQESISVAEGRYMVFQPRNKIAYTGSVKNTPKDARASSALALLSMSRAQLDASFTPQLLGQATLSDGTETKHLKLSPKSAASFKTAELWIDVNGMPRQIKIVESDNSVTTFLFTKPFEKNAKVDRSEFAISPPSGTKIHKT